MDTPKLDPVVRKSVESGLITQGAVSENRRPESSVSESINFDFDSIGSAVLRKGTTTLGSALPAQINGLYHYIDTVNSTPRSTLLAIAGTAAYYLNGTTFTSIRTGLTTGSKARFTTFLDQVFMVNGTEATTVWDGNTAGGFVTTGNAASAPIGKYIENFRSRIWIAGNPSKPDRVYYTSIPSSVATPVVTWNTSDTTGQWIDISPSDGDVITALRRSRNNMLVFKQNRLYRVYSIAQTDPDPFYAVGTYSSESVVDTKAGIFFHHSSGFYQYNIYGVLQEISRPIIDIVRAVTVANYANVVGWLEPDGDHICWEVGDVTYRGVTYPKLVVRYTISTQVWTHRSYPVTFTNSAIYRDSSTVYALTGDSLGNVYQMNTGTTDNGTPIQYSLIHRWDNVDGLLSTRKTVMECMFTHEGGAGAAVAYQVNGDNENDWTKNLGDLNTDNTGFNSANIKGRKLRMRIFGNSSGQQFTYNGYELVNVIAEFLQFETDNT